MSVSPDALPNPHLVTQPDPMDQQLLENTARRIAADVDVSTLEYASNTDRDLASAWLDTVHATDADGAENWQQLVCTRYPEHPQWHCSAFRHKSVLVPNPHGGPDLDVSIPPEMAGTTGRYLVALGLPLIQQIQLEQACHAYDANAAQHEAVREAFARVKGRELELDFGGAAIAGFVMRLRGDEVHFAYAWMRDAVPQLRCWSPGGTLE